jgi:hypothetical protein
LVTFLVAYFIKIVVQKNIRIFLFVFCFSVLSCSNNTLKTNVSVKNYDLPILHGENISSFISNSGVTLYRLKTKIWNVYVDGVFSYWSFPKGVFLEKFDSFSRINGYIKSDTAYFFEKTGQWQLIGNVYMQNSFGETFETSELFYNQRIPSDSIGAVYTDQNIKINKKDKIIFSQGMKANSFMTEYIFYNNSFKITFDEKK